MHGYHKELMVAYKKVDQQMLPWTSFRRAIWSVVRLFLRQVDLRVEFTCPICSKLPWSKRIVVLDAITLGIMRDHFKRFEPKTTTRPVRTALTMKDDAAIATKRLRSLIRLLSRPQGISQQEWNALNVGFGSDELLGWLLKHLSEEEVVTQLDGKCVVTEPDARTFLQGISQEQPASGFWDPAGILGGLSAFDLYSLLAVTPDADLIMTEEQVNRLRLSFPQLYFYVSSLKSNKDSMSFKIPSSLRCFLIHYMFKSTAALRQPPPPLNEVPADFCDPYVDHIIAPNFPLVRLPNVYEIDGWAALGSNKNKRNGGAADKEGTARCTKIELKHASMTPGVMHMSCPHGIAEIALMMPRYEGPTIPFEILYTRFKEAPGLVIYDNACNLFVSCQRREPWFFRQTRFFSDRLHWRDHSNCSSGFDLDAFMRDINIFQGVENVPPFTLRELNSQVSEQLNRRLQKVRSQMAYMSHDNFRDFLTVFLVCHNRNKSAKIQL